jgi:hypothetical protein
VTKDEALHLALEELENCADLLKVFEAPLDSCVGATMLQAEAAITAIKQALAAPVQPVSGVVLRDGYPTLIQDKHIKETDQRLCILPTTPHAAPVLEGRDWSLLEATQESLREHMAEINRLKAAQPTVPDALNPKDENPAYAAGWNDCRAEMLKGMK